MPQWTKKPPTGTSIFFSLSLWNIRIASLIQLRIRTLISLVTTDRYWLNATQRILAGSENTSCNEMLKIQNPHQLANVIKGKTEIQHRLCSWKCVLEIHQKQHKERNKCIKCQDETTTNVFKGELKDCSNISGNTCWKWIRNNGGITNISEKKGKTKKRVSVILEMCWKGKVDEYNTSLQ